MSIEIDWAIRPIVEFGLERKVKELKKGLDRKMIKSRAQKKL